jgi:hypothetical protein
MKDDVRPEAIDQGRVFDGYEFRTHNLRNRYIREDRARRPQWLNDHPGDFRKVPDNTAQGALPDDAIIKVDPGPSSSRWNASDCENSVAKTAAEAPLKTTPSADATIPAAEMSTSVDPLLRTILENAIIINGRTCIMTEQFASMLDVSVRTFHRIFEDGKGPGKIKLPGTFYDLDEALKWTVDRKRHIKRHTLIRKHEKV